MSNIYKSRLVSWDKGLSYEELEDWYYEIINLDEVQELLKGYGLTIRIDNNHRAYGFCNNRGDIGINIFKHVEGINNLDNLVDTIAHEISHNEFWEHGEEHNSLTNILRARIKDLLSGRSKSRTRSSQPVRSSRQKVSVKSGNSCVSSLDGIYTKLVSRR